MNRLRELREERNWTLKDVGDLFGTHNTTISKYELGTVALTDELIGKFCRLYEVTADYLLGFSVQPHGVVTEEDAAVLAAYHAAPEEIRSIVDKALEPYTR